MSDVVSKEELEAAAAHADAEAEQARTKLQKMAANNARVARALRAVRGDVKDPSPVDVKAEMEAAAARALGLSVEDYRRLAEGMVKAIAGVANPEGSDAEVRSRARARAKKAGAPELYVRATIDRDPEDGRALSAVRDFMADPDGGFLFMFGGLGTHKSGAACWALGQVHGGEYISALDLLDVKINERARWQRIRNAPVVVIDDLGAEKQDGKGEFDAAFLTLWEALYGSCAHVIVTTNAKQEQIRARFGEKGSRFFDRFRERTRWVGIEGESKRKTRGVK